MVAGARQARYSRSSSRVRGRAGREGEEVVEGFRVVGPNPTLTLVANSRGRSELESGEVGTSCFRQGCSVGPGGDSQQVDGGRSDDVLQMGLG